MVLEEALGLANSMRAQIRSRLAVKPGYLLRGHTNGTILGFARTRDGPVFERRIATKHAPQSFLGTGQGIRQSPADTLRAARAVYLAPVFEPETVALDPRQRLVPELLGNSPLSAPAPSFSNHAEGGSTVSGDSRRT